MAGDRAKYTIALKKWQQLHEERSYSAKPTHGTAAVFRMQSTHPHYGRYLKYSQTEMFEVAEKMRVSHAEVSVNPTFTKKDFFQALADRAVATIAVISPNGGIARVSTEGDFIDWWEVSQKTTHLKRGMFWQRFCAGARSGAPVPFGAFALTSLSNLHTPVTHPFSPELYSEDEKSLAPYADADMMSYDDMKAKLLQICSSAYAVTADEQHIRKPARH